MRRHGDNGKATWANERICVCGKSYRTMPPYTNLPSFAEHVAKEEGMSDAAAWGDKLPKYPAVEWLDEPEDHDYDAAREYLSLIDDPASGRATDTVTRLRAADTASYFAKDILRASQLRLLPESNHHVDKDLRKIKKGVKLSPVLLVRGFYLKNGPLVIVDGYHRVCAAYYVDENAPIRCRIVT